MSLSSTALAEQLAAQFTQTAEVTVDGRTLPRVDPTDEAESLEILRLADAEGLTVLPMGCGSKMNWTRPAVSADFVMGTRGLTGIVAYEPGDGTITARAGTTMAELESRVAADGFALSPQVPLPQNATLGGVVAAGQSGCDRPRNGPVRHHVLGARVALAEGKIVRSGGRLVKNVTGYDLHRLHCGAFGTLGVLTEISLRLLPAPEATRALEVATEDTLDALVALAGRLRTERLTTVESLRIHDAESARMAVTLSGLGAQVEEDVKKVAAVGAPLQFKEVTDSRESLRELRDVPGLDGGPLLHLSLTPSLLGRALGELRTLAAESGSPVSFFVEAETAEVCVFAGNSSTSQLEKFVLGVRPALKELRGARLHFRNLPTSLRERVAPMTVSAGSDWMIRLKNALDPNERFGPALGSSFESTP